MTVVTDKRTVSGVQSAEWYGCDLYLTTDGNALEIIEEPKMFEIVEEKRK